MQSGVLGSRLIGDWGATASGRDRSSYRPVVSVSRNIEAFTAGQLQQVIGRRPCCHITMCQTAHDQRTSQRRACLRTWSCKLRLAGRDLCARSAPFFRRVHKGINEHHCSCHGGKPAKQVFISLHGGFSCFRLKARPRRRSSWLIERQDTLTSLCLQQADRSSDLSGHRPR